ncbi:M48 family metallopeptidase [Ruegeria atlantica]|uniref:M48 family metallopeptidase n=1 Tax=Ruegeria atlantica TaxID=81569 RepID=UPI001C2C9BF5|nr:SprT family zinc-dependent metalloprotease [Ruegeria atlantica]
MFHLAEKHGKISIHVHPNGSIQVDAPADARDSEIKAAVLKRARWIVDHVEDANNRLKHILPREYVSGESHYYLGRRYLLKVLPVSGNKQSVKLLRGKLQVESASPNADRIRLLLDEWYRSRAADVLYSRLEAVSEAVPWLYVTPSMKLLTMKKQWGSCSASGKIILNPRLIKAPRECIDYVITHEICHLREHNHSRRFYRELDQLLPNWRSIKGRLDGMAEAILAR